MKKYIISTVVSLLFYYPSYGMLEIFNFYTTMHNEIEKLIEEDVDPHGTRLQKYLLKCSSFDDYCDLMKRLLEYGVNPNIQQNISLLTPLHLSALSGSSKNIDLLLEYQADPNFGNNVGETPLMIILKPNLCPFLDKKRHKAVLGQLLKGGYDTKILNNAGQTASDIARIHGLDNCADIIEHYPFPISLKKLVIGFVKTNRYWYTKEQLNRLPESLKLLVSTCNNCELEHTSQRQLKLCTGCRKVYYCNRICQLKDWNSHKAECGKFKKKTNI